ncbi:YadA-like family protein [Pseudomonas spelaei]
MTLGMLVSGASIGATVSMGSNGVTVDDGTTVAIYTSTGMTISNGPSVTTSGIDADSRKIINLAAGTSATDAVNLSQLDAAKAAATTHYYSVSSTGTGTGSNYNNDGASSFDSVAIGQYARASDARAMAIGFNSQAQSAFSVAIGDASVTSGDSAVAIGARTISSGGSSIALGNLAVANSAQAIALGGGATANSSQAIALGPGATVNSTGAIALGTTAMVIASARNAIALGSSATATHESDVALGANSATGSASSHASDTIDGKTYSYAGTSPRSVVSVGSAGNERQITNVAAGNVASNSTDAINGSQLSATNQAINGVGQRVDMLGNLTATALGGNSAYDIQTGQLSMSNVGGTGQDTVDGAISSVSATANKGWNLTAQGVSSSNVAPGASVDLKNSDGNVVVNKDTNSNGVTFDLAKNLKADSLTTGNSKLGTSGLTVNNLANSTSYTSTGMTISNGPSVTTSGIDAGSLKILNVADGMVSSTSKDAVNGSQLFITNQNVAGNTTAINNINNGAGIKYFHVNSTLADGTATGADSVVIGPSASATATNAMALGNGAVAGTANSIALGSGATTAAANPNTGGTINGVTFTYAGGAPIGVLSLGAAGSERQITNVAAGSLTRTSTDAVNGSQLFATNQTVTGVGQRFRTFGSSTVTLLGGNSAYDIQTGQLSMSNVGGTGQDTVDGAISSVSATANKGWNLTAQGVSSSNVAPGASVDLKNSDGNVVVNKDTNSNGVTFDLAKNLKADSLTTGNSKLGTSGLTVNNLANSTSYTSTGMTISNGPSVTTSGIDAGSLKILNVADGVVSSTSKDAVNGSQLFITNQNVAGNTTAINNINNGAGIKYFHVNSTLADGTATGKDSVVVGPNALASSLRSMAIGSFASASNEDSIAIGADANASAWDSVSIGSISTAKGVAALAMGTSSTASGDYTIAIGPYSSAQGIGSVALGTDARALFADSIALGNGAFANNTNDVALGAHSTTGSASSHASDTIDGITYTYSGTSPTSVVSVGSAGQKRQITNVAAGNVSLTSTDAINGSQLFATNQAVNGVGQRVNTVGNSTATVFGGNAAYDNSTGKLSMSNVGGTGQNTVDGAISSMNAVVNKGWNLTAQSSGSTNVAPGASVDLKNSDGNVVVSKDTNSNDVTFDLSKNLTADILTTGFSKLDTSGLSVNDGANNAIYASTGMTISNGPSVTTSGIDAGSLKITHVADGALSSTSKDAVNGSQLNTTNTTVATNATNTNTYLGGGANVMNGTAPSYSVGGTTYNNVGDAFSAVDSGGAGVVQRTSVSDVVTMVAGGGTAANPGSAQKLTNLAAGTISSSSTDAVNGSQLNSVSQQANAGWNVTAQGANSTKVAPGASVDLKNSDGNVVVSKDTNSNDVTFNLAKDLTANSVTTGNTLVNTFGVQVGDDVRLGTTGLIIANGPRVTNVGIDAGSKKITHVADGTDATDGVNFSQLTSAVAGSKSHYYSVSDGGAQGGNYNNDGATGANAVAAGVGAVASGIDATALGSSSQATAAGASAMGAGAVASAAGATATGNGSKASGTGSVAMGDRAKASAEGSVALGSDASDGGRGAESYIGAYSGAQNNAVGTVSVGNASAGKTRTVSNVADGKQATDAVNLRQLDGAVKESKTYTDTQLTNVNTSVTTLGNQVTQNTANISNLQNGTDSFFQVNNKDGKSKPSATGTNAAAGAAGSVASGNSSLALGTSANATANNAVALGSGSVADRAYSVSVGSVGNERQITNVAAGTASTDVVNVSQLKSSEQGGLRYDSNTNGNTNYNQVTLGNGQASGGTRISNVAPGTAGTDAVNVNQLNQGMTSAIQYTDDRFNKLNRDIGSLRQDTYAGIAGALATANLPQAYSPGASMVAAGVGNYQGQSAVSVGLSTLSDNGKWVLKVSGTTNSRGQTGIGAGVGYQW